MVQQDAIALPSAGGVEVSLPIAGIGGRSYAFVIDWHIRLLLALAWMVGALLIVLLEVEDPLEYLFQDAAGVVFFLGAIVPILIYLLYHPVLEVVMKGRTPGKRMAGIRIVTRAGQTPGTGALLVRNIFRLIDMLPACYIVGLVATAINKQHARIGDLAAGTVLVYDERTKSDALQSLVGEPGDGSLSPGERELVLELLERWRGLAAPVRRRLGLQLLQRHGITPADDAEATLRQRLQQLLEEKV